MLTERQAQYLRAMGIQAWIERRPGPAETLPVPAAPGAEPAPPSPATRVPADPAAWQALEAEVAACTRCPLHKTRTRPVFGVGSRSAQWLVIGEAPGAEEDRQGEPFVGRAGKLLDEMLAAIGLDRRTVYIANILKSRPPNNRDPTPEEVQACEPYLRRQIELLRPRIILAVGRIAAQNLLKTDTRIGALRGRVHRYPNGGIPVIVTYHPAYLLRTPAEKRKAWQDLTLAVRTFREAAAG